MMNRDKKNTGRGRAVLMTLFVGMLFPISGCRVDFGDITGGGSDFLSTGQTESHFRAIQIDPRSEDSAGPQFVVGTGADGSPLDLNGDGLADLVSAWNQSQPVQIHLQRRSGGSISFETVTLAGSVPAVAVASLAVADFNSDGQADIAVLLKETLLVGPQCLDSELPGEGLSGLVLLYLGPSDPAQTNQALAWQEIEVGNSFLQGSGDINSGTENGGFTAMAVGDIDMDGNLDIVVAWNSSCGDAGSIDVVLFTNGGAAAIQDKTWLATRIPDAFPKGDTIKDIALGDIDQDGDLDIVATFPTAPAMNVRWYRNPVLDIPDDVHLSDGAWQTGTVAQVATGADAIADFGADGSRLTDIDGDGIVDVVIRSTGGRVIQWFKAPAEPTSAPLRNIPWQVFTIAEFVDRTPEAVTLGDINGDGQVELVASAVGGLAWFDSQGPSSLYDQWTENLIIDDAPTESSTTTPATTDPNVSPEEIAGTTSINSLVVVDLDGDGKNDLVATFDRSGLSGLTNDALVWFRNTQP
ncbi:MAG: VCBS repeat-containing protein [Planctomycetes bacterium]|nr:VCBS repeat-containing protein [Planctomycetota bacterium]